jgi:hypothetical protein
MQDAAFYFILFDPPKSQNLYVSVPVAMVNLGISAAMPGYKPRPSEAYR